MDKKMFYALALLSFPEWDRLIKPQLLTLDQWLILAWFLDETALADRKKLKGRIQGLLVDNGFLSDEEFVERTAGRQEAKSYFV